jgi:hypothetical protein
MMPALANESPNNVERGRAIAAVLERERFDVLCLEKAFDERARQAIVGVLGREYGDRHGPLNEKGRWPNINGGVWVLSREPMTLRREIEFDECADEECFSRKGAMLLSGSVDGHDFDLIATHLQGDDIPAYNPPHQLVRDAQVRQIATDLVPLARRDVPLVYCGDLSTPRGAPAYENLLSVLGAENGPSMRPTLEDDCALNDLATDDTGRTDEMDYILVRQPVGRPRVSVTWMMPVLAATGWDFAGRRDLSYRHPVVAVFRFKASS